MSLRGTNRSFDKPIFEIDAKKFETFFKSNKFIRLNFNFYFLNHTDWFIETPIRTSQ